MSGSESAPVSRRTRFKTILRIGGIVLLLCMLLYLATPWLVPGRWIAATLSSRMQRLMNRPVRIDSVAFDYGQGLTIRGFRIGRREGFGEGALAETEEMSIPLGRHALARPARLLSHLLGFSTAPFERIQIREPQCWAVVNDQGALNIADLNDRGTARLPARLFDIIGLTINFSDLRPAASEIGSDQQQIVLPSLKCSLTPSTGRVNVEGGPGTADEAAGSSVALSGDLTTPRLSPDAPLGGGGSIQWRDLDLGQVPRLLIPFEHVQALRGASDGSLELRISEDLTISFAAEVALRQPTVLLGGGKSWPLFERSNLSIAGHWDPQAEYVAFSKLNYEAPQAVSLSGRGSFPVMIDPNAERRAAVALSGRADSLDVLRQQLAVLGIPGLEDLQADGPADIEFDFARTTQNERYDIRLDATASRIAKADRFDLPPGETKRLALTVTHSGGDQWHWQRCDATIGRSSLQLAGNWPVGAAGAPSLDGLLGLLGDSGLKLAFETADLAELLVRAPVLSEWLPRVDARGPGSLQLDFAPRSAGSQLSGHLDLGIDSALTVGQAIKKRPGELLSMDYSGLWSAEAAGRLEEVNIDLRLGPARMATTSDGADVTIAAELPESEWDREKLLRGTMEASVSTTVEFVAIEHIAALFPGLTDRLRQADPTGAVLSGNCRVGIDANLARIHGKSATRVSLRAAGDELGIRAGDIFELRRGNACRLELDYRYDARPPQTTELIGLSAELPSGSLDLLSEWQEGADGEPRHDLSAELRYSDLPAFASHFPSVSHELKSYELGGSGRSTLEASAEGDIQSWQLDADLTATDLAETDAGWLKPAGVPLTLALDGRLELESPENSAARLRMDRLNCSLGASTLKLTGFTAEIENSGNPARAREAFGTSLEPPPVLRRLQSSAHVDAALDGPWRVQAFNKRLDDWLARYATTGKLTTEWDVSYDGALWTVTGLANATDVDIAAPPQLAKPAGLPAEFEIEANILPAPSATSPASLDLRLCELRVDEMSASANGTLVARSAVDLLNEPEAADLVFTFHAPELGQITQVWPGLSDTHLDGRLRLAAALAAENGGWSVDSAMLDLDDVRVAAGDSDLSAHGVVQYDQGRWHSDSTELRTSTWRALLAADGCPAYSEEPLQLAVRFGEVDGNQAAVDLRAMMSDAAMLWTRATDHAISGDDLDELLLSDSLLGALHVDAALQFDALQWFDSERGVPHRFDEVASKLACRRGDCEWELRGGYEGGLAQARIQGNASDAELQIVLTEALSTERIQLSLRAAYPGLEPTGTVDYSRIPGAPPQLWSAEEGLAIAYGEVIVRGGVLRGKAAEGWVATVFPRLNLAAFNFSLMRDWFTEYADGRVQHHAIFLGKYYNLYASGWENNDASVAYQIGIDLLGGLENVYWATSGSGRIPLFESVTRLSDNGEVLEETVNYVPLDFVKAIVWGANPIHTAYMALRKRIVEEK